MSSTRTLLALTVALAAAPGQSAADPATTAADATSPAAAAAVPPAPAPTVTADPAILTWRWSDGLIASSEDGLTRVHLGGRLMADWAFFSDHGMSGFNSVNGAEFRRARLDFDGMMGGRWLFAMQFDMAHGDGAFKDVYVGWKGIPVLGTVRLGHIKEPIGMDQLTSSKATTFMERSLPDALVPAHNTGALAQNEWLGGRMTTAIGGFRDSDAYGDAQSFGNAAGTARVTALPVATADRVVHVGVAASVRRPTADVGYAARPEAHLAEKLVDTGPLPADRVELFGAELAGAWGRVYAQAEGTGARIEAGADATLWGGSAQIGWMLSGESRPYKNAAGVFARPRPRRAVGAGGWGAWELAARAATLDLSDRAGGVGGGRLSDLTLGANWDPVSHIRLMINGIYADRSGVGTATAAQARAQVSF